MGKSSLRSVGCEVLTFPFSGIYMCLWEVFYLQVSWLGNLLGIMWEQELSMNKQSFLELPITSVHIHFFFSENL